MTTKSLVEWKAPQITRKPNGNESGRLSGELIAKGKGGVPILERPAFSRNTLLSEKDLGRPNCFALFTNPACHLVKLRKARHSSE